MSNSCDYVLKRGKNKGQQCESKCLENTQYCKKHSSKDIDSKVVDIETNVANTMVQPNSEEVAQPKLKPKKEPKSKEKDTTTCINKEKPKKEPKSKEKSKSKTEQETSIKVEVYERKKISTTRNIHGNFVLENNLIVHPVNRKIIGRQEEDKIIEISIEDIEYCKEHGLCYEQPSVMYFRNPDIEKEEIKLQKQLLKLNLEKNSKINENNKSLNELSDEELEDDISENELESDVENDD
jgi:hypothetical protein